MKFSTTEFSFVLLLFGSLFATTVTGKETIYIAGFYPDSFIISAPNVPYTSNFTESHINNNNLGILRDYDIKVVWKNSRCLEQYAMSSFIDFIREDNRRYLALFGPACSDSAAAIARVSHFYGLSLFTYSSRSPHLGNQKIFPYFIRGNPSDAFIVAGWIKFIRDNNWRRLAIINQQDDYFLSTSQEAQIVLTALEIEHYVDIFDPQSVRFEEQVETILSNLDTRGYRVIISELS